jgi:hypothetical protein
MERSLVLVKPDGVQRGLMGEVIARLERRGLLLAGAKFMQVSRALAEEHYAIHKGKPFYDGLITYITSSRSVRRWGPPVRWKPRRERSATILRWKSAGTSPTPRTAPKMALRKWRSGSNRRNWSPGNVPSIRGFLRSRDALRAQNRRAGAFRVTGYDR